MRNELTQIAGAILAGLSLAACSGEGSSRNPGTLDAASSIEAASPTRVVGHAEPPGDAGIERDTPTPTATPTVEPTPTPTATPTLVPRPVATPVPRVATPYQQPTARPAEVGAASVGGGYGAIFDAAGVPAAWRAALTTIANCESGGDPSKIGDGGRSLGLFQLWTGWFAPAGYSTAQAFDPVVNARVAVYVRLTLGRFGGKGGWTCADLHGIY